jgi:hypothetical protein
MELMKNFKPENNRAFTVLFAVLMSGVLLAIGYSISSVALKELLLSFSIRESNLAYYSADGGMECALYYDVAKNAFPTTTPPALRLRSGVSSIDCGNASNAILFDSNSTTKTVTTSFKIYYFPNPDQTKKQCADVIVKKENQSGNIVTTIESRGYNTCDIDSKKRVERGIKASY